jgi:hypothetical protein
MIDLSLSDFYSKKDGDTCEAKYLRLYSMYHVHMLVVTKISKGCVPTKKRMISFTHCNSVEFLSKL